MPRCGHGYGYGHGRGHTATARMGGGTWIAGEGCARAVWERCQRCNQSPVNRQAGIKLHQLHQLYHSRASDNWQHSSPQLPAAMDAWPPRIQPRCHAPVCTAMQYNSDRFRNSHPSSYFRARVSASEAQRPKHLCARVCASGPALLPVHLGALKQVQAIFTLRELAVSATLSPASLALPCPALPCVGNMENNNSALPTSLPAPTSACFVGRPRRACV